MYHFVAKNTILKKDCWVLIAEFHFDIEVRCSAPIVMSYVACVEFRHNEPNFATSVKAMGKNCNITTIPSRVRHTRHLTALLWKPLTPTDAC